MSLSDVVTIGAVTVFGLAFLGAGLYIASIGVSRIRIARGLREAGSIPLRDVPETSGLVEFEGTARASDEGTLEGPLSGTDCLAYTVSARARDADADRGAEGEVDDTWTPEGQVSATVPFTLEDGDDRVEVDPTNALLSLDEWETARTAWTDGADLDAATLDRLDALGLAGTDTGSGSAASHTPRQYREQRLEAGRTVHVFGGSVVDSSDPTHPVTVAGDDWFEISVRDRSTVRSDRRRSGTMYVVFGGLIAVPGVGFTLAGIVGLVSTVVL